MACKPDSVRGLAPRPMTIPLAPLLRRGSSCQPGPLGLKRPCGGRLPGLPRARPLFGIAPGGACRAVPVARSAVGSYPTVSPLPARRRCNPLSAGGFFSVALSLGLPRPGVTRHHCFMESGLSSHAPVSLRTLLRTRSSGHPRTVTAMRPLPRRQWGAAHAGRVEPIQNPYGRYTYDFFFLGGARSAGGSGLAHGAAGSARAPPMAALRTCLPVATFRVREAPRSHISKS
ncbi:hypothetical protein AKL17_2963 [Frigidibacter mobilis]|uniref:Uncharacterized protein n=1 Tax=Frigidibacter mobilis TaxID=1335048 RepID=A0A159Z4R5_9RHOB|nr:hypothetical protein AKL17_2963 [Frigidibacter mobilis]